MTLSSDDIVLWQWGLVKFNATLIYTWVVMVILVGVSYLSTRNLVTSKPSSRWQAGLEVVVTGIRQQIRELGSGSDEHLAFGGTLFLFIALSNLLAIVPGYHAPTASLSTTAALAISVFIAVPLFGIARQGVSRYLHLYVEPTIFMLPFNIIGEVSRTLALAVRLYGNMMSGAMLVAILLAITPLFFPIVMQLLGLLTGMVQAYIFAVLAMVYLASATLAREQQSGTTQNSVNTKEV